MNTLPPTAKQCEVLRLYGPGEALSATMVAWRLDITVSAATCRTWGLYIKGLLERAPNQGRHRPYRATQRGASHRLARPRGSHAPVQPN